jgi:hypothetical protein
MTTQKLIPFRALLLLGAYAGAVAALALSVHHPASRSAGPIASVSYVR